MNPITPIMTKPIPTACEILINSLLSAIVYRKISAHAQRSLWHCKRHTLGASVDEKSSVLQKLARNVGHLSKLIRHRGESLCDNGGWFEGDGECRREKGWWAVFSRTVVDEESGNRGSANVKMSGSSGERRGVLWQHLCPRICFSGAALVIGIAPRDGNHVLMFRGQISNLASPSFIRHPSSTRKLNLVITNTHRFIESPIRITFLTTWHLTASFIIRSNHSSLRSLRGIRN